MTSVNPGDVFLGKYRIERVLGQGGMGVVVGARHVELDEPVAIKFLHATFAVQQEQVERFLREGRAAVKIKSEHVARVRDVGKTDDGTPYMIMEHLEGQDLGELLRKEGSLPYPEAIDFVLQACEALAEAHVAGIVHRDLKPANLFLTERADGSPCVKVLDFGISKLMDAASQGAGLTATNGMMGSPLYMAPEQLSSAKNVDHRVDIWALGVILFELISGKRPFPAEGLHQLVFSVATEPPQPLRHLQPDVPEALHNVIMRCLEKRADERYPDVGALAQELAAHGPTEARASVERIARILGGVATHPGARRRTGRTMPESISRSIEPVAPVATAATMVAQSHPDSPPKLLATTNGASSIHSSEPPPSKRGRGALVALASFVVLAVIVGVLVARRGEQAGAATAAEPTPRAQAAPSAAAPPVASIASVAGEASVVAPEPSTAVSAAPAPSGSSTASWIAEPSKPAASVKKPSAPQAAPSSKASAAAKPSCDPPYTIDGDGNKKYKKECF